MKREIFTCDTCGEEIQDGIFFKKPGKPYKLNITFKDPTDYMNYEKEVCFTCYYEIKDFISKLRKKNKRNKNGFKILKYYKI